MNDTKLLRYLAAALVLANGLVHLQQRYNAPEIELGAGPTIQRLFLLNVVASVVLAALLVWKDQLLITLAALGFSLGTVGAFLMARYSEIFGYSETIWRTPAIIAVSVELGAAGLLSLMAARQLTGARPAVQPLPR